MTRSKWMRSHRLRPGLGVAMLIGVLAAFLVAGRAAAQPSPPARFFGSVTLNDQPAPPGIVVEARIGGVPCGAVSVSANGRYTLDVLSAATRPGCGRNGATVTFLIGGLPAAETGVYDDGSFLELNLSARTARLTAQVTVEQWVRYQDEPCRTRRGDWCVHIFTLSPAGEPYAVYRMVNEHMDGHTTQPVDWVFVTPNVPTGRVDVRAESGVRRVLWQRWVPLGSEPCEGVADDDWCVQTLEVERKGGGAPTTWYRLRVRHPNGATDSPTGFIRVSR